MTLYAEHSHATLAMARDLIARQARELAELLRDLDWERDNLTRHLIDAMTDTVVDHCFDIIEAAERYDDVNPLREAA